MEGERADGSDSPKRLPKLHRQRPHVLHPAKAGTSHLFYCGDRRPGHVCNSSRTEPVILKKRVRPLTSSRYRTFSFRPNRVSRAHRSFAVTRISTRVASPEVSM